MNITVPTSTNATIGANVTDIIGSFGGVITLILGIILALFLIEFIVDMVHGKRQHTPPESQ